MEVPAALVLYDGVCGLCDRTVQFLLRRDQCGALKFAPLQGPTAQTILASHPDLGNGMKSLVLVRNANTENQVAYVRSAAVLLALRELGGVGRVLAWLGIVPRPIRDAVYDWIACHRYRWFGKFDACKLPPAEWHERFLP